MIQKRVVDCDRIRGIGNGGESGGFSWGDQLFGLPDVLQGDVRKGISPVGGFSSLDCFKIAELRLSCHIVGVKGPELLGSTGGFCELLSEGGQEWGPPSFRLWGGA